jgi:hypothetical protein
LHILRRKNGTALYQVSANVTTDGNQITVFDACVWHPKTASPVKASIQNHQKSKSNANHQVSGEMQTVKPDYF